MDFAETKTVLVVDDEPEVRKLVAAMAGRLGYMALTADSGDHALALYRKQGPIALLIADVVAPGMSGPMLANQLSELQPGLKVLFISGYENTQIVQKYVVDRGYALLPKPFTVAELKAKLDEFLPSKVSAGA